MVWHLSQLQLQDFLDDELQAEERGLAQSHVESCPDCQAALTSLRTLVEDLKSLPTQARIGYPRWCRPSRIPGAHCFARLRLQPWRRWSYLGWDSSLECVQRRSPASRLRISPDREARAFLKRSSTRARNISGRSELEETRVAGPRRRTRP